MMTRRSPRVEAAMAAARRGWPVFPLYPFSKYPAVKSDWESRATTDLASVADWWQMMPYANVGVATGPAGLVVVDLDAAHGQSPPQAWADQAVTHGRDVLRLLAQRHGEPDPSDTYTVSTPGGGEHRYFLAPPGVQLRNSIGRLGWHIDTRAGGGFIVAAGSGAKVAGELRLYRVVRRLEVAPLPDWLATALTPPPPPESKPVRLALGEGRRAAYGQAALAREADKVRQAQPGTRASTVFWSAVALGELVGAGVFDEAVAHQVLTDAARSHDGVAGFTAREAEGHIRRGLQRGRARPRRFDDSPRGPRPQPGP
jgi:hypothetical protein